MLVQCCKKNNSINVLFIVCAADHYYVKIGYKFQSKIRIPNVCKSNLNSNFKIEIRKFKLRFTSLVLLTSRHFIDIFTARMAQLDTVLALQINLLQPSVAFIITLSAKLTVVSTDVG